VSTLVTTTLLAEASFRLDHFPVDDICSCEHENAIPNVFRQAETATASSLASTGAKFMAETAHRLKRILERIREDTEQTLSLLRAGGGEERVRTKSFCYRDDICNRSRPVAQLCLVRPIERNETASRRTRLPRREVGAQKLNPSLARPQAQRRRA
jgi:hypothetical protein